MHAHSSFYSTYIYFMYGKKMDSKTIMELKRLSESSNFVINNLAESIKELVTTGTDSPDFDKAMKKLRMANREADELLEKQQRMIKSLE
jgi:hypothetical protein